MQMHGGGYDCGLFAIAFATALVHGQQPEGREADTISCKEDMTNCVSSKKLGHHRGPFCL